MKTILICLACVLVALTIGLIRQSRLVELEEALQKQAPEIRAEKKEEPRKEFARGREARSRLDRSSQTPPKVLQTYLSHSVQDQKGVTGGPGAVMDNRETFDELMKLNLSGKREFIELVLGSESEVFEDDLFRCEAINLCLCAMAHQNPEEALDYLLESDERIAKFYANRMGVSGMVHYVMGRVAELNPVLASKTIDDFLQQDQPLVALHRMPEYLAIVAVREPDLAFEMVRKFPDEQQIQFWREMVNSAKNTEELTETFEEFRGRFPKNHSSRQMLVSDFLSKARAGKETWDRFASWLSDRDFSEAEKLELAPVLLQFAEREEGAEVAKWLVHELPPSTDRDLLILETIVEHWEESDPTGVATFLEEEGLSLERMYELMSQKHQ